MMLSTELKALAEEGCAIYIGSTDAEGRPDCVRAFSALVEPDSRTLRIGLIGGWKHPLLENLRAQPFVSVTFSRLHTFESFQLKGEVVATEEATEEDRARAAFYRRAFVRAGLAIGIPDSMRRLRIAADTAIRVRVDEVRRQTPGPGAGERVELA